MGGRVLVADDDTASNDLMCYLLRAFGHAVVRAGDGAEAITLAVRERPDVIVMDLDMPGVGGFEAARCLSRNILTADIPCVAVTAYAMAADREQVLRNGFRDHITKPIDPETFVTQVEMFMPAELRSGPKV